MNQLDRDKRAVSTVLKHMTEASFPDIALRGGEGLSTALLALIDEGTVERIPGDPLDPLKNPTRYRLATSV